MKIHEVITSDALAIAGMCKNAGKTTALTKLIENMGDIRLAMTSIGSDGETCDVATHTPKPQVYIKDGTVFATCTKLIPDCDATLEILDTTDINTPLGDVVISRTRSDGNVRLCGASTVSGLMMIHEIFKKFGAVRTIFDGAISRRSLSVPTLCKELVLCTGASYSPSQAKTVSDTKFIAKLFCLPVCGYVESDEKFKAVTSDEAKTFSDAKTFCDFMKKNKNVISAAVKGAVTDTTAKALLESGVKNITVSAEDPSRILLSSAIYEKCGIRNIEFTVENAPILRAVTINPYSAYDSGYDKDEFFDKMSEALKDTGIPVFDCMR